MQTMQSLPHIITLWENCNSLMACSRAGMPRLVQMVETTVPELYDPEKHVAC